ncbi:MAG: hypothetical protein LBM69_09300 [Lachnospiraceae bacterium]|jgi:transglutaminase/protease-like cytokinesis protein 3|nr:hypothetical protein [Lachnospiraceae bacterium]
MKRKVKILSAVCYFCLIIALISGCSTLNALPENVHSFLSGESVSYDVITDLPTPIPDEWLVESGESQSTISDSSSEETTFQPALPQQTPSVELDEDGFDFTKSNAGVYCYYSLTPSKQLWYQDIVRILGHMLTNEVLSSQGLQEGLTESDIEQIFQCVLNDHPEYFYVDGYSYTLFTQGDELVKIEFSGAYNVSYEKAKERKQQIDEQVAILLEGSPEGTGDYEKVKYVYDTLILSTEYDLAAPDNQNIYSVFVNKRSVCQGYAKATQYLLNELGVESTLVFGQVNQGESHAWNLVRVNDNYYYVDSTWGDASYQTNDASDQPRAPQINYDYLCVTTQQILTTHILDDMISMPECNSLRDNYYVKEGLYFTAYDEEQLFEVFSKAKEEGKTDITIKCDDMETYVMMEQSLIEQRGIFNYIDAVDDVISYAQNEKQLSMTFWMTKE